MFAPLKGIRVIDLTQVLAGPYATYQLALMGAEVIKVEPTTQGDWTRVGSAVPGHDAPGMGAGYLTQNADKQTLAVDLKSPQGLAIVQQLIAGADVFVENFKPGTAARLGLSFEAVSAVNDKILYCSISAYGQDGPISHRPAYDHVVQGMCGIMRSTGTADTEPNKVGAPYIDYATGLNAAFAIVSALHEQRARPRAVHLDVAMLDSSLLLMASMLTQALTLGMQHRATGNEAHSRSPSSGAFETTDGMLMVAANNERQFRDLCKALGHPEWLTDERWATPQARARHVDPLRQLIEAKMRTRSAAQWEALLDKASVPAARCAT
ncbi:MAG: CoA transferase [Burkholderiaceae bacterium]